MNDMNPYFVVVSAIVILTLFTICTVAVVTML